MTSISGHSHNLCANQVKITACRSTESQLRNWSFETYYARSLRVRVKLSAERNATETKPFLNSSKTVLFQPKQNAKTSVKRFSCFSQSQPVSAFDAKLLSIMLSVKLL